MTTNKKVLEQTLNCFKSIIINREKNITDELKERILAAGTKEEAMKLIPYTPRDFSSHNHDYNKIWTAIKDSNNNVFLLGRQSMK